MLPGCWVDDLVLSPHFPKQQQTLLGQTLTQSATFQKDRQKISHDGLYLTNLWRTVVWELSIASAWIVLLLTLCIRPTCRLTSEMTSHVIVSVPGVSTPLQTLLLQSSTSPPRAHPPCLPHYTQPPPALPDHLRYVCL